MSSSDGESVKLPELTPMTASVTKSGLKLYKSGEAKGGESSPGKFIYFPSVTYARRKLQPDSVKTMAYGTSDILKLLVSGGVPPWVFQEEYWGNKKTDYTASKFYSYRPSIKRKKELWEPKCHRDKFHLKIDKALMEAKLKQKEKVQKMSERADHLNRHSEKVLTKKANEMRRGLRAYLDKLERRSQKYRDNKLEDDSDSGGFEDVGKAKPDLRGYKKPKRSKRRNNSPVNNVTFEAHDFDMYHF